MGDGGSISSMQQICQRIFQIATRRDIVVSSVVGLCGFGLFWGARQFLAPTNDEQQVIKSYGNINIFISSINSDSCI